MDRETLKYFKDTRPLKVVSGMIETEDGLQLFGLITARDEDSVTIVTNPQNPVPLRLEATAIADEAKGEGSLMPTGVLNLFSREEILDLL